jgi:hypothetical protein
MKSNTDTQLSPAALLLKAALAAHLSKTGHTLLDLDEALSRSSREKTANSELTGLFSGAKDFVSGLAQVGFGRAAGLGAVGGLGAYGAYKGLKDSDRQLDEADAVKLRLALARRELETELASRNNHH